MGVSVMSLWTVYQEIVAGEEARQVLNEKHFKPEFSQVY